MDEINRLHHIRGLCEKTEFEPAMRELKLELRGVIGCSLAEQKRDNLILCELRVLAKRTEVEKFELRARQKRI